MSEDDALFERLGLGYRLAIPKSGVDFRVNHVRRSSGELSAEVIVRANLEGVRTTDGVLSVSRLNLHAPQTRERMAKYLASRTPGFDIDWAGHLELLVLRVITAEKEGSPIIEVGDLPVVERTATYTVEPLVRKNAVSLLYGPGGSGKSLLALACAMSVAAGREIVPGMPPSVKGPVLYLDWETDHDTVNERMAYIAAGHDFPRPRLYYRRCNRPIAQDAESLGSTIAELGIKFVVVDSAAMAMGAGNEHSDAADSVLTLFDALRVLGVTVQLVDHVSKTEMSVSGKTRGKMPYGSIYKVNLARSAWEVRNTAEAGDEGTSMTLVHTKSNDSAIHSPVGLVVEFGNRSIKFAGAPVALDAPMSIADRAAEFLEDGDEMTAEELSDELGITTAQVSVALRGDKKRFRESAYGRWSMRTLSVAK